MSNPIYPGLTLSNRYRVVRELGHGGFGRTYLAQDSYRFDEPCVLKEFAPQVQGSYALQKSQELFEREAGVLYKLENLQIPRFRELFRVNLNGEGHLFLVQDYVDGQTYRSLLEIRRRQGKCFSEAEVTKLLFQLLPVLEYIHSLGVIHRDISPDNLILRNTDGLPVLIDFGGVKQVVAAVESQFAQHGATPAPTRLGKIGYAPDEQMQAGIVFPHSDLYALAATVLVLLTGKEPPQLIDSYTLSWKWRSECTLSPALATILDKMLAHRPPDRFQSAGEVLQALSSAPTTFTANPPFPVTQPPPDVDTQPEPTPAPVAQPKSHKPPTIFLVLAAMVGMGGIGWLAGNYWVDYFGNPGKTGLEGRTEEQRQEALRDRRRELKINYDFYVNLVNETFYASHPELKGRVLTNDPSDATLRTAWDQTAYTILEKLSYLSEESRQKLGQYNTRDIDRWKQEVNQFNLSSAALYDLADAQFFYLFPDQPRNQNLIGLPIGQVWQAITTDKLNAIQSGRELETVTFDPRTNQKVLAGNLSPGSGKAYIAFLKKGQTLQLKLEGPENTTRLSMYTPGNSSKSRPLLEDSPAVTWSGTLDDSGYYEFVIIPDSSAQGKTESIPYQLTLITSN